VEQPRGMFPQWFLCLAGTGAESETGPLDPSWQIIYTVILQNLTFAPIRTGTQNYKSMTYYRVIKIIKYFSDCFPFMNLSRKVSAVFVTVREKVSRLPSAQGQVSMIPAISVNTDYWGGGGLAQDKVMWVRELNAIEWVGEGEGKRERENVCVFVGVNY
jgi:hypothetical protein